MTIALACLGLAPAGEQGPMLTLTVGAQTRSFSAAQLSARADAANLAVPADVAYLRAMRFRAVPLRALLAEFGRIDADTIEFRATDGFVAQIPRALIEGRSAPWVAIEDPKHPWPALPRKKASAGPFYLVWQNPRIAGVSTEQWPYNVASITAVASPVQRWPALALDASVPAESPLRRGQTVFVANCMSCHRAGGAGEATIGPDLLQPVPATSYLTDQGLRALIRNPAAVRSWPEQRMPGFDATTIPDTDVDALIAYLHHLADRQG
jgi:mono/diheme cytochrome c family protein